MMIIIWLVALGVAAYLFFKNKHSYFKSRGINNIPVTIPLLGNLIGTNLRLAHFVDRLKEVYNAFPDDKFVGFFEFLNPVIILRDPELIKQLCVKDYEYFLDHRIGMGEDVDPLFGRNLFSLKGQKWRDMRSTLSPAFTGSKMRHMVPFMLDCSREMSVSLKEELKKTGASYLEIETKDLCTRYTNDVVASCAFGLKVNSHSEKDNYFYRKGKIASSITFRQVLVMFGYTSAPYIMNALKISLFPKETSDFFRKIISDDMINREENKIIRPDLIHLLLEAKKGNLNHEDKPKDVVDSGFATVEESAVGKIRHQREWTEDDLIAQAVLFFVAGFDTVATSMTFLLYELAINPDVQEKLLQEIDESNRSREGELTYNHIQEFKYLDMCLSETLRKWSPNVITDRICIKPYNLGKPNAKATEDYVIKAGQGVWIPIFCIHRNPKYYPDPEKFDPERFSDENKHNINPSTYLPFGAGPRNCIGSRFALLEVKILLHQILSQFRLVPSSKTQIPCRLETNTFNLKMQGGHWLRLQSRN